MAGNEAVADIHLGNFPFLTDQNETPESAATKFAEHCHRKTGKSFQRFDFQSLLTLLEAPDLRQIVSLIEWLDGHLRVTHDEFDAALKHDITSSAIFDLYSDNSTFWYQIVACFHGLIGRW
jgi:hypothetical protein